MRKKPVIHGTQEIAKTRLFRVESVHLSFSNGEERHYERLRSRVTDAVIVVPLLGDDLLLVREYCVGVENYILGFAKGLIDPGEEVLAAANRELQEEVGYAGRTMEYLTAMTMNPGYSDQHTHIVKATDLYPATLPGDEPEPLEVVRWPLQDIRGLLKHPEFTEARSIAALMFI